MAEDDLEPKWMCKLCFRHATEIGMIGTNYALIYYEDEYHLLGGQGHNGDIFFTFPAVPRPDPDPECLIADPADNWQVVAEQAVSTLKMSPDAGYSFVSACKLSGYGQDEHKCFDFWLFDYCGRLIAKTAGIEIDDVEV